MSSLCGIEIVALTDHNTCKNCPAFFVAAKKYGIIPVAGMELTTSEDIHVVCLFETLEDAMHFDAFIDGNRVKMKNRPEIFGRQTVLDENDEPLFEVEDLLINATQISISEIKSIVEEYGGVCYPAHIDRESNGIIAVLGTLPEDTPFNYYELHDGDRICEFAAEYGIPKDRFIISSDAHYLTGMRDKDCFLLLPSEEDPEAIRASLFRLLRRQDQ